MENKPEKMEVKASEPLPEWEKPQVTEFDVNSTTLSGGTSLNLDGLGYS